MKALVAISLLMALAVSAGGCDSKKPEQIGKATGDYIDTLRRGLQQAKDMRILPAKQCVDAFHASKHRHPKDLAELRKAYPSLPKPPKGMKYKYDPTTGKIEFVPKQ